MRRVHGLNAIGTLPKPQILGVKMIAGFSPHALNQLAGAIGGGSSTTVVVNLDRLAEEVAALRSVANEIATSVANPTWSAGDELCRRAATALENGWYDDAARDAAASIAMYPYRGAPHLLHALALLHTDDGPSAYIALENSVRYGRANHNVITVASRRWRSARGTRVLSRVL